MTNEELLELTGKFALYETQYADEVKRLRTERDEARAIAHARGLDASELEAQNRRLQEDLDAEYACKRTLDEIERDRDEALAEVKKLKVAAGKGILKDAKLTVDQYLAWKREDK